MASIFPTTQAACPTRQLGQGRPNGHLRASCEHAGECDVLLRAVSTARALLAPTEFAVQSQEHVEARMSALPQLRSSARALIQASTGATAAALTCLQVRPIRKRLITLQLSAA